MISYSSIVVGTDGSDSSLYAVRKAASLAAQYDAELTIVCAYFGDSEPLTTKQHPELYSTPVFDNQKAQEILDVARGYAEAEGAHKVHTVAKSGAAAAVLLLVLEEVHADLLVVGNKGMGRFLGRLMGTIPSEVARKADVDVMLVNTEDEQ